MNTLTLPSESNDETIVRCPPAIISVNGAVRRDLELLEWVIEPGPSFGGAFLVVSGPPCPQPGARLGDRGRLPAIGAKVRIRAALGSGGGEFVGSVTGHSFVVDEQEERFTAECRHRLEGYLARRISSLWRFQAPSALEVKQAKIRFNAGWNSRASSSLISVNGRLCRVFDSGVDSQPWSAADALGYLLAAAVPADVEVPTRTELEALAGGIDLGRMDITGKTAAEALVEVARNAGLELRSARQGVGLVFYRPGRQGRRRDVRLQPGGSALSVPESNLWRGRIHIRRRPCRRSLLVLGQRKQYESTFQLAKGWDPGLQTDRWRDFVRSESENWPKLGDVYRKWVVNEHGWYSSAPWSLPVYSFSDISSIDFTVRSARRFLPCLSTDRQGQGLGVVVEIRCGQGLEWRRWRGPLWVSRDECAIYLGGDALPGEFFEAAVNNGAEVRVTAVVEADARIIVEVDGDPNAPRDVIDLSSRAAWRLVHASSIFYGASDVGSSGERDDSHLLRRFARRYAEAASTATEAELTLAWVDTSFHVGDIVERIDGRDFELSSNPDSRPVVRSVRHDLGARQTTHLVVSG